MDPATEINSGYNVHFCNKSLIKKKIIRIPDFTKMHFINKQYQRSYNLLRICLYVNKTLWYKTSHMEQVHSICPVS